MGLAELFIFIAVPVVVLIVTYRIGHRIGKAEGRLLRRDEAEGRRANKAGD